MKSNGAFGGDEDAKSEVAHGMLPEEISDRIAVGNLNRIFDVCLAIDLRNKILKKIIQLCFPCIFKKLL